MAQKIKLGIVLCVLWTCIGSILCEDIDQELTAPSAPEINNGLAQTFDNQNLRSQNAAVEAELRHHPGHDTEHFDFEHTPSLTPSQPFEHQSSESWTAPQEIGFTTNQFEVFPIHSPQAAPPVYKAGSYHLSFLYCVKASTSNF